jgi:PAS domain S-box-containing protein
VIGSIAPEFQTQPSISLSSSGASIQQIQSTSQVVNYALAKTPNFPIWIGVYDDPHDALASWREAAIPILLGSIFMIIMVLATAVYIRNRTQVESALSSALNESENRYLKTLESVMDAIVAIDDQQKIILFNKAAERMFGYLEKEVLGQPLGMLMPRRFEAQHQQHVNGYASSQGEARSMSADGQLEIVGRRKNGQEFPIESSISLVWIGGQQQMTASLRDVTERRKSEKSMASLNRQLRALFQNREKVREDERSHIAKELHDDLGQQLTGLRLDMSWALNRVRDGKSLDLNRLNEMRASLDQTVTSVRKISSELRPRYLDDLGLGEAISNLANDFLLRAGLRVELRIDQQAQTMVTPTLTPVYRLLQEALNNIVKHAQASQVEIELSCVNKQGILKIKDDGIGFETSRSSNGIGLLSMRERATALGADFKVISSPGAGTVIEMIWQLEFKNTIES